MSDDNRSDERLLAVLRGVLYPGFSRDLVSVGVVAEARLEGDLARVRLRLPGGRSDVPPELARSIREAVEAKGWRLDLTTAAPGPAAAASPIAGGDAGEGPRAVLAVASAKGGVGKSTVAANLACAFASGGLRVGLLDADVYGPSLPILMGANDERPAPAGAGRFRPIERHGVRCMSMGFFLDEGSPVIWRGPMVAGLVRQFLADCDWGDLDLLVVDLPPGTGDALLTLAQEVRLDGAVVVTTPSEVALADVRRGIAMLQRLEVPILGVVENLAFYVCPECGEEQPVFPGEAGRAVAEAAAAPLLARVPLETEVCVAGDAGRPPVLAAPGTAAGRVFAAAATALAEALGLAGAPSESRAGA